MSSIFSLFYCDSQSVFLINPIGRLRQLYTPFNVVRIFPNGDSGTHVYVVDEVKSTRDDRLIYIINDKPYYHSDFAIIIGIW